MIDFAAERTVVADYTRRLRIKTPGPEQVIGLLSGGNQQTVVLAQWLAPRPLVLIIDEPTRGVDVGAKAEIYALMRELAAAGLAILVISSNLPESLTVSDRVLVMREGRIRGSCRTRRRARSGSWRWRRWSRARLEGRSRSGLTLVVRSGVPITGRFS